MYMYICEHACVHTPVKVDILPLLCVCVCVCVCAVDFKGYQLLSAAERGDVSRAKKLLTCTSKLSSFRHMLTLDSALVGASAENCPFTDTKASFYHFSIFSLAYSLGLLYVYIYIINLHRSIVLRLPRGSPWWNY